MKLSLSAKWFLWLSTTVAVFGVGQVLGMLWWEVREIAMGEDLLREELTEISVLVSISSCVFLLMSGGFWFISKRMIRPIRAITEAADAVSDHEPNGGIEGVFADDEVGRLVTALNGAFDRYRDAVHRLDRFAGHAAHQLRTPLASLRSLGEVCLQRERTPADYRDCIGSMLELTHEMAAVVDKLLTIARLHPARIRAGFAPVDLGALTNELIDLHTAETREAKGLGLSRRLPACRIAGDAALAREAVFNVLDNAVRFTPEGGSIAVELDTDDGCVTLAVRDTGPGLPESLRGILTAADGAPPGHEPTSGRMGLLIVSEIMRIHRGRIEIGDNPGGGTCVRLVWPATTEPA
jgi:signal transduction histidine kinase